MINQILLDRNEKEVETFVACHEAMHWVKDQNFFSNNNRTISQICKNDIDLKSNYKSNSMEDVIERQTNYLSAALLLPKEPLKRTFFTMLRYKNIPNEPIKCEVWMNKTIKAIADMVGINFNPVKYRLFQLKILTNN